MVWLKDIQSGKRKMEIAKTIPYKDHRELVFSCSYKSKLIEMDIIEPGVLLSIPTNLDNPNSIILEKLIWIRDIKSETLDFKVADF